MLIDYDGFINRLKGYEQDLNELSTKYNPNDNGLKNELLVMKMSIVFYNYVIDCYQLLKDVYSDKQLFIARETLTMLSYVLTGISAFKAPIITLPALTTCLCLSLKNRDYNRAIVSMNDDQANEILDLLDSFEDYYASKIDSIFNNIDIYEDENTLDKLQEPEKSKRIACKKLMEFLRDENMSFYPDEKDHNLLIEIINEALNTNSGNFYELLQKAIENYDSLNDVLIKLSKKDNKLSRKIKFI